MKEELIKTMYSNFTNLEVIELVKDLLNCVVNDIEYMNKESEEIAFDYMIDYDLGNGNYIKKQDLESLCSIIDTCSDIIEYNKGE